MELILGRALNIAANAPFSLAGWFRTRTPHGAIVSLRNSRAGAPVIDITADGGRLSALVRADGKEFGEARVTGGSILDGQWHSFVLTRDASGRIELFQDGKSQGQNQGRNSAGAITTDLRAAGVELYWARVRRRGLPYFAGNVDELALFQRVLSADDIRQLAGR